MTNIEYCIYRHQLQSVFWPLNFMIRGPVGNFYGDGDSNDNFTFKVISLNGQHIIEFNYIESSKLWQYGNDIDDKPYEFNTLNEAMNFALVSEGLSDD